MIFQSYHAILMAIELLYIVISKISAPVKIEMYNLVAAGGRSAKLNPFTKNTQFKKTK